MFRTVLIGCQELPLSRWAFFFPDLDVGGLISFKAFLAAASFWFEPRGPKEKPLNNDKTGPLELNFDSAEGNRTGTRKQFFRKKSTRADDVTDVRFGMVVRTLCLAIEKSRVQSWLLTTFLPFLNGQCSLTHQWKLEDTFMRFETRTYTTFAHWLMVRCNIKQPNVVRLYK